MSNRLEYLVKYSVAPAPSRDYYGLKVLQDEVIVHLWRISHGPHKAPIIHSIKLTEFDQEKSLQDKIRHGFGEHLLKHIKNIAEGNLNTLLTLPKSLIGRISRYLNFTDVIKLSSLSHVAYEVFNADLVWQILYEKDKNTEVSLHEREKAKLYGWKQLYKDKQIEMSLKTRRNLRIQSSIKFANDVKTDKLSLRLSSGLSKPVSKTTSTNNIMTKKRSESSSTDPVTISLSKMMSDTLLRANTENEKLFPQKRNMKNASPEFDVNKKNEKKENLIASKMTTKRETKNVFKCNESFDKKQNKLEKYNIHKVNNINVKLPENKSKSVVSKTQSLSKSTVTNAKSSSNLAQISHSKTRSKAKTKLKKVTSTQCEIFNTNGELSNNPFIVENFDLADLIKTSLKNIRSPRSVFNYDFNYTQQSDATKNISKTKNEICNIDKLKQLKSTRSSTMNDFSNRIIRSEILEKLSEKSESFSGTSGESLVNDKKSLLSGGDNESSSLSEKYMKARVELLKSLNWKRSDPVSSED